MLKKYVLLIEEINNEDVDFATTFNMNDVVASAKGGNPALIKQLHSATKIGIYERQISLGKKTMVKRLLNKVASAPLERVVM